jgi:hypothetical protein
VAVAALASAGAAHRLYGLHAASCGALTAPVPSRENRAQPPAWRVSTLTPAGEEYREAMTYILDVVQVIAALALCAVPFVLVGDWFFNRNKPPRPFTDQELLNRYNDR